MTGDISPTAAQVLVRGFFALHPSEAARAADALPTDETVRLLSTLPVSIGSQALGRFQPERAAEVLAAVEEPVAVQLLISLHPVRAAGLLARFDEKLRTTMLSQLPDSLAQEIQTILRYPPGTAGYLMDARFLTFLADMTAEQALNRLRTLDDQEVSELLVINESGRFLGSARLQDLVRAEPGLQLGTLLRRETPVVRPMTSREEVVELLNIHQLASLPVVDFEGHLLGLLDHSALVTAAQREASVGIQRMVGAGEEERALSSPWLAVRSRLPWLNINLLTAFLASAVVGLFEQTIATFTALAVLLPVVAGQSGNTGAQALAVTMRGLALREVRTSHWWRLVRKETVVGFFNGVAIAVVTSVCVLLWSSNVGLGLVIFSAMIISMVAASAAGAVIPVVLVALGRDPATASSIILTTIADIAGFFSFLSIATLLSGMLVGL